MELLDAFIKAVEGIPNPPAPLFGDVDWVPATAPEAVQFLESVANALQAAVSLLEQLNATQLGLDAWLPSGAEAAAAQAANLVGSLRIEELSAEASRAAAAVQACAQLLVAVAMYAPEHQAAVQQIGAAFRPWAMPPASAAAVAALKALSYKLASLPGGSQQQPMQQLVAGALPDVLQLLRPVIMAKRQHEATDRTRLEPYAGPEAYERSLAASQLRWLLSQLDHKHLAQAVRLALPYVLASVDDPSPAVQAQGLRALHYLACEAAQQDLSWQRELLLDVACRSLAGCDDAAWPAAVAAAVALVCKLEGRSCYAPGYAAVLQALIEEAERSGHLLPRAAAWLRYAPALFPVLGLQLVRHIAHLLPLLLRWCAVDAIVSADSRDVRLPALEALHSVIMHTWPRMPAHAAVIWPTVAAAYATASSLPRGSSGDAASAAEAAQTAVKCGVALWHCGGVDFQHALLVQQGGGQGQQQQQLLESVMEQVEQASSLATGPATEPASVPGSAREPSISTSAS